MRAALAAKSKSCHIGGGSHESSARVLACTCSLSSRESSSNLAAQFDYRFDLPRSAYAPEEEVSYRLLIDVAPQILSGFTSPPDQPPELSS